MPPLRYLSVFQQGQKYKFNSLHHNPNFSLHALLSRATFVPETGSSNLVNPNFGSLTNGTHHIWAYLLVTQS
jgi:hypothetical protein